MTRFYQGQRIREISTGAIWYVTAVFHPQRGASLTVQHNRLRVLSAGRATDPRTTERRFRWNEVELIRE